MDEIISKSVESLLQITVQNYVTDYIQANSAFRAQAGKPSKVVRVTSGKCCKWCSQVAGTYIVGVDDIYNVDGKGHSVFQRHENCDCLVTWHDYRGIKNVHTKESYTRSHYEAQKTKLFSISDTYGRGFAGGVNWTGGRYKAKDIPVSNIPVIPRVFRANYEDVTESVLSSAVNNNQRPLKVKGIVQDGKTYLVDNINVLFDEGDEYSKNDKIASLLQNKLGVVVQHVPKVTGKYSNINTPDYLINGLRYDLKNLNGTSENAIKNVLGKKKVKKQAQNFIIDITRYGNKSSISLQIKRLYNNPNYKFVNNLVIVDEGDIKKIYIRK